MSENRVQAHDSEWREAIDAREWERAHDLLSAADSSGGLDGAALEQFGEAARWTRRYEEMIESFERAADALEREGDRLEAARVAVKLTIEYFQRNELTLARASLQRADEILGEAGDSNAAGMVLYCRAAVMLEAGDHEAGVATAIEMREMAERLGDRDLEALGLMMQGRACQLGGDYQQGAELLDGAAGRAIAGGLELWTAGVVLCANISASRHRCDVRSASEWSDATMRWCKRNSLGYFPGLCRLHVAETLNQRGDFEAAVAEVEPAIDDLQAAMPRFAGNGLHELGEIRRRQGDLRAAAELFERAVELGGDGLPGLILLRLDEGRPDTALALARGRLQDGGDRRLGAGRGEVLPAAAQAAIETGELATAREYVGEIERLADACETPALFAALETARGRLAHAEGDHSAAIEHLRAGQRLWSDVGAPFECALARAELARAELARGEEAAAEIEVEAAAGILRKIGAAHALERVSALLSDRGQRSRRAHTTMLFTDIVGSTQLVEALGDEAWEALLSWHDRALRSCVSESGGTEVKHEGDGLFATFDDADTALRCACEIQRKLRRHQEEQGFAPSLRIGVHAAEVNDRGGDYGGRGVHLAARVMAAADAGEVLVTDDTLELASGSFAVTERRRLDAKGIAEPIAVASVDWRADG